MSFPISALTRAESPGTASFAPTVPARLAGLAAVAAAACVVAIGSSGVTGANAVASPWAVASAALTVAALVGALFALAGTALQHQQLTQGTGRLVTLVAAVGTVLTAGGYWSSVFVVPSLAEVAPGVATSGLPSITAGFIASYAVMGVGWLLVAVHLVRTRTLGLSGWFLGLAALICLSPLPFRFLPLCLAVAVALGWRLRAE